MSRAKRVGRAVTVRLQTVPQARENLLRLRAAVDLSLIVIDGVVTHGDDTVLSGVADVFAALKQTLL